LPTSAAASNNLNRTALSTTGINQYNGRIDHAFSASDNAFVRFSVFDANGYLPLGSTALNEALIPAFGYNLRTHTDNLSASWSRVFSPSWLNELRFGWMRVGGGEISPNAGLNFAGQTGLQGVTTNPLDTGYPNVTITGFSVLGESTQYVQRQDTDYEIYDNVLWHHGTHTVKFGFYFVHLDVNPFNAQNARGTFAFVATNTNAATNPGTGNALGNFLLGDPNQATVGTLGRGNLLGRTNWAHFYIEDSWKITPSVNLDIGLRYEYNQNMRDANNGIAIINTLVPGGEFVIASNNQGQISPALSPALLAAIPIPHITSNKPAGIRACFSRGLFGLRRG